MTPQEVAGDKSTFISFDEARSLLDAESDMTLENGKIVSMNEEDV